ncbi:hypothetical protein EMIHUDRAFT_249582 [Emiliania huxleyi CCMP1516]|uniref:Poly [ADP-ribose] polymerase n=2 Tax=Emiliania huxleyi TaxID=2903 RepID=A0A0D3I7Y9_EMIH1|nr:hypothetical protein EMIHUDRAFT_249582 [Emiliania huxleyi CCMP1516]EOD07374.1 hypothetical protein EMIHUDRAFT_249582 [Emiliania huxleyi CCMP1516]|eukprot:XP_005759803.1 hypothetical protein EMIHUDRAFT_249582 [Emiliania huxleyi CCMP1516]
MLLFHGTAERAVEDVLAHQNGLDPRFSNGGFYGSGIYLAEDPSYPIGGRYAHRISGSGGRRVQLLIVKAALGTQEEMGQRISAETRAMRMPGVRVEGPPRLLYNSVRGGPHRPFLSGGGESGCDASIVHVAYESRQMYPAYVIEVEIEMGAEVVAAVQNNSTEGSASAGPASKQQRTAAHSAAQVLAAAPTLGGGAGSGGGGSSHSAAHVPLAIQGGGAMLDEGCIELMHSGQTAGQAGANPYRVQIIDLRPIKNPMSRQGAEERYRLKISDGRHYMHAMLSTSLNPIIQRDGIRALSIVRIDNHIMNSIQNRKARPSARIGHPQQCPP